MVLTPRPVIAKFLLEKGQWPCRLTGTNLKELQYMTNLQSNDLLSLQKQFFKLLNDRGRSPNTLKNYKTDLDCFNQYLLETQKNLSMDHFSITFIKQYGHFLQNKYNSDNSRRRRVQALRIFFDYLVDRQVIEQNPVRSIPSSPKFLDIPRPTPFADVKTLWECLLEESNQDQKMARLIAKRNQIALLLIYGGGLKVSDLATLKMDQIFTTKGESRVLLTPPKREPYTVPLPKVFTTVYANYCEEMKKAKREFENEFEEVLFNANPYRILAGGLSTRGIEIVFEEYRKKLIINLTPKSLRQACVFKWLQSGESESTIKEWMGVAPSYSLKLYKEHLSQHIYRDDFLEELYRHHNAKKTLPKSF